MIGATIVIGALITLMGSGAFILSSEPATLGTMVVGVVVTLGGVLMRNPARTALVGHLVVIVTFLGMLISAPSIPRTLRLIGGEQVDAPVSSVSAAVLGILCLLHVTMSVRWFLARRRLKKS